eukprot:NODE_3281_length_684_cov_692.866142_g2335_i0.p3 GENE.NODE_3281_length_684_cov_692.866142_g2335_i0~~NODE_3281_length_684_cov_692.866142_g2335_i0.p3  ORF type:complete len:71 (-),score=4.06 NODE_3281_length_684_cov_692.866142_g2335_i0:138-350(-)
MVLVACWFSTLCSVLEHRSFFVFEKVVWYGVKKTVILRGFAQVVGTATTATTTTHTTATSSTAELFRLGL